MRVADCGGWTDTWFARHGAVLHIAVLPGVDVRVTAHREPGRARLVTARLESFSETYTFDRTRPPGRHPLIEAAVADWPEESDETLDIAVRSDMPPGASTGTSAAVAVGLVTALGALAGKRLEPSDAARAAHRLETERLGLQSGIQDQIAAAYGGINFVQITEYPHAEVRRLTLDEETRRRLDDQIALVYLGRAHHSSEVHEAVIRSLGVGGAGLAALNDLRGAAEDARDALLAVDLPAFGRALRRNTEAQSRLHPSLVSAEARALGALVDDLGALGWKVNGAGGDGGSVTVLLGEDAASARSRLQAQLTAIFPRAHVIPIRLAETGAATALV